MAGIVHGDGAWKGVADFDREEPSKIRDGSKVAMR
jgi:hypothetical protein